MIKPRAPSENSEGPLDAFAPSATASAVAGAPDSLLPQQPWAVPSLVWRAFILVALVVVAAFALGKSEVVRGMEIARNVGWPLAFVLVGTPLSLAFDAIGWRLVLGTLGCRVSWLSLVRIRLVSETLVLAAPGGAIMAEAAKMALLSRRHSMAPTTAVASLVLARALHLGGAAVYFTGIAVVVATLPALAATDQRLAILGVAVGAALVTVLGSLIFNALLAQRGLAARLGMLLARTPLRRLSAMLGKHQTKFEQIDGHTAKFLRSPRRIRAAARAAFVVQWLIEGMETAFLLMLLDETLGLRAAFIVDALTSFARALVVFAPAGIGVQETTQVLLLQALNVRDGVATIAAFIFIKRMKELFWIVTGGVLAAATRDPWQPTARSRT